MYKLNSFMYVLCIIMYLVESSLLVHIILTYYIYLQSTYMYMLSISSIALNATGFMKQS